MRKFLKWIRYVLLIGPVCLAALYLYFAARPGKLAIGSDTFKGHGSSPLVFAHRGGAGIFPENTMAAFELAAKMGVDVLELDVHVTKDGALMVLHDPTVDRTTDGTGKISDMSFEDVRKLDAGYKFSQDGGQTFPYRGKGLTIPTLEEVFVAHPNMLFNIEPKLEGISITKPLCDLIRKSKMADKTMVGSFKQSALKSFRLDCPEVATSASPFEVVQFLAMYKTGIGESYNPIMQALQIPAALKGFEIVTKDLIAAAHKLNLKVHVWTINDPAEMERLIALGVDGIMTDYPERLLKLLKPPAPNP